MLKRFAFILVFFLPACGLHAQTRAPEVPTSVKNKISARLKLFYEYKENEQWDKVYDFLLGPQPISKPEYVKNLNDPTDKLEYIKLEFQPIDYSWSDFNDNEVSIQGCEIVQKKGESRRIRNEIVVATLENEEWYFSNWGEADQSESWCK